jgi:UDP-glucose 4-epimerase
MKSKILLIGGNGFIGSHLADALLARGVSVRILDVQAERFRSPLPGVEYFNGDCTNAGTLRAALSGCDTLIHLAHNTLPLATFVNPDREVQLGLGVFAGVLEMALQEQVGKVMLFSSGGAVYGEPPSAEPVEETIACRPISPYGLIKLMTEKYLHLVHHLHGLSYLVVRPSNPFGPRQNFLGHQGAIPIFMHRLLTGQPIAVWGDGRAVKDYLYITDLVGAVVALLEAGFDNEVYNLGSGIGRSVGQVIKTLEQEFNHQARLEYRPAHAADVTHSVLALGKLTARTGWMPQTPFEVGLRQTKQWYDGVEK